MGDTTTVTLPPPPQKKPCRVCDQFKGWNKSEKKKQHQRQNNDNTNSSATATMTAIPDSKANPLLGAFAAATGTTIAKENKLQLPKEYFDCPLNSQELGRNTWSFLHTMAAYYPDNPTQFEKDNMKTFLNSFSWVYPCGTCAEHLRKTIKKSPPTIENAEQLSVWLCDTHNKVNKILGKPKFDCSKVFERWRDGPKDGSCDYGYF